MSMLPDFQFHAPTELAQAVALLAEHGSDARLMAGGTDLLMRMKTGRIRCGHVVSLSRIEALRHVSYNPATGLHFGAATPLRDVADHAAVPGHYPALATALDELATPQVRNKATVAGNLCNASPCADTAPPTMAYGGIATLAGPAGERKVRVEDFITGPGLTALQPGEIVTAITVPPQPADLKSLFIKHSPRSRVDISAVSVGLALLLFDGVVERVDLFLGTVAPTPMRAAHAEAVLRGKPLTVELVEQAAAEAEAECRPVTDMRATAEYKRKMVRVLSKRALKIAGGLA